MSKKHARWIDIDSPAAVILGTAPHRPWWHHVLDDILQGLESGLLRCIPWIIGGITTAATYYLLTR